MQRSERFDLVERTARFGEAVIEFAMSLRRGPILSTLISQLVRAGTSVGANMAEADECEGRKEFRYRLSLCLRESRETQHWLRMIVKADPTSQAAARKLWREADELKRIFVTIRRKTAPTQAPEPPRSQ